MRNETECKLQVELHGVDEIREKCEKLSALMDETEALIGEINQAKIIATVSYAATQGEEEKMENKQEICNALCKALQLTKDQSDLESLAYTKRGEDLEFVTARYFLGTDKIINVTWDSEIVMIRDILKRLS